MRVFLIGFVSLGLCFSAQATWTTINMKFCSGGSAMMKCEGPMLRTSALTHDKVDAKGLNYQTNAKIGSKWSCIASATGSFSGNHPYIGSQYNTVGEIDFTLPADGITILYYKSWKGPFYQGGIFVTLPGPNGTCDEAVKKVPAKGFVRWLGDDWTTYR